MHLMRLQSRFPIYQMARQGGFMACVGREYDVGIQESRPLIPPGSVASRGSSSVPPLTAQMPQPSESDLGTLVA